MIDEHLLQLLFPAGAPGAGIRGVFLVGGCLRDLLRGGDPVDFDVVVAGDYRAYASDLARRAGGRPVDLGKSATPLVRIVSETRTYDITPLAGPDIDDDLKHRDFTINAMAFDLAARRLIDPTGGRRDLRAGCLRMVAPQGFDADPLRLLRAYRLAATLGCAIDPATAAAIAARAEHIRTPAAERLRLEMLKLLASENAHVQLTQMAADGALTALLPELAPLRGCSQSPPHDGDVFEHTLRAAACLERLLTARADPAWPAHSVAAQRAPLLKLAILLHDIGKPAARSHDADGKVHFYGHARRGARWARRRCLRLRFSKRESEYVAFIVARHMYPFELFAAHRRRRLGPRAMTRFCMRCGAYTLDLLTHALADVRAKAHARPEAFEAFAAALQRHYRQRFQIASSRPPLLNGHDLASTFGLDPSPLFKNLLAAVRTAQLAGEVTSRAEALDRVRILLARRRTADAPPPAADES